MKILLIGNYERDHQFSMQKFSACLEQALSRQGHQVTVLKPLAIFGRLFGSTVTGLAKWLGYIDKYLLFPFTLKRAARWADIIHICDHSNAIYVPYIRKYAHLVTCHDMMAVRSALGEFDENNHIGKAGQFQQQCILTGLKKAGHIASVSNATKLDIMRLTKQPDSNLTVIHNGLNYSFNPVEKSQALELLSQYGIRENTRFLLHVGGNQWYKNRIGVLAIFNQIIKKNPDIDLKLIMVGKSFSEELRGFISQHDLHDKLFELIEPSTQEICALYSLATAFIFPSLCEGFGWPIIEAQACNTLVFTSNREPMTEVGGDGAIYIDPVQPTEAASVIVDSLANNDLINKTINAGQANLPKFSTSLMVERYFSLYETIILKHNQAQ